MKKFIHNISIFFILVFYLYGCNDTEVYTPEYPINVLEEEIFDEVSAGENDELEDNNQELVQANEYPIIPKDVFIVNDSNIIDEAYKFPVTYDDQFWKDYNTTTQDRIDISKVPEDIAKNMTTTALIETALAYPMFPMAGFYNDKSQKINALINFFDYSGLSELLLRDDTAAILVDLYAKIDVEKAERDLNEWDRMFRIEYLLGNRTIWEKLKSESEMELLADTVIEKYTEKLNSNVLSDYTSSAFFHALDMSYDEMAAHLHMEVLNDSIFIPGDISIFESFNSLDNNSQINMEDIINMDAVITLENAEEMGRKYKNNIENSISNNRAADRQ